MINYCTWRIQINTKDSIRVEINHPHEQEVNNWEFDYALAQSNRLLELNRLATEHQLDANLTRELGENLFKSLFEKSLQTQFINFYNARIQNKDTILRVELDIHEQDLPELVKLPWEFMCIPKESHLGAMWLGTNPNIVLSRYRANGRKLQHLTSLGPDEKLRIGLVVANPADNELNPVEFATILADLKQLERDLDRRIELIEPIQGDATPEKIDNLLKHRPHIFHFIGHGEFKQHQGFIALVEEYSNTADWIDEYDFSELFNRYTPQIVFLQACESATTSTSEAFSGIASNLVQRKVPAVVAMQYKVSNATATLFAREFYEQILNESPVDCAVQEGRRKISQGPHRYDTHDVGSPIIFMQAQDGYLFERKPSGPHQPMEHTQPHDQEEEKNLKKAFLRLNYEKQARVFREILFAQVFTGAFFISGPTHSGQMWLCHRLISTIPNLGSSTRKIYLALDDDSISLTNVDRLWQALGKQLGVDSGSPYEVTRRLCVSRQNQHIFIALDKVTRFNTQYPQQIIEQFWHQLLDLEASNGWSSNPARWLLLFLLDDDNALNALQNTKTMSSFDKGWTPHIPIKLAPLSKQISKPEIDEWLWEDDVLMLSGISSRLTNRKLLLDEILDESSQGNINRIFRHVCKLCGKNWSHLERKWILT